MRTDRGEESVEKDLKILPFAQYTESVALVHQTTIITYACHTPTISTCFVFQCTIMSPRMTEANCRALCPLHAEQTAWCSAINILNMIDHRSDLSAASNITLLVCFGVPSCVNQHGTVTEADGEQRCTCFSVLQFGSKPCASSEHRNIICWLSSFDATQFSLNEFSFDIHASKLYFSCTGMEDHIAYQRSLKKHGF